MRYPPLKIIISVFVAAIFGFCLAADATVAVFSCNGNVCCCKSSMPGPLHVLKKQGYSAESGFCPVPEGFRCCMKKATWPDSKAVMALPSTQNLNHLNGLTPFDIKTSLGLQSDSEPSGKCRFPVKKSTIPIYLSNLMLLC